MEVERDTEHPDRPVVGLNFEYRDATDEMLDDIRGITSLKWLNLCSCYVTDAWLRNLASFPFLESFVAWDTGITDMGLGFISLVRTLKIVDLSSIAQASDDGIRQLAELKDLEYLCVTARDESITVDGIALLKSLSKLRHLELSEFLSTKEILTLLMEFPSLESLELWPDEMAEEALAALAGLTRLKTLAMSAYELRGDDLAYLSRLTNLEKLDVEWLPITDRGLRHLAPLTKLRVLHIETRGLSDVGLAFLKELPNLEVLNARPLQSSTERCPRTDC